MILPSLMAVITPVLVGLILGVPGVFGLLAGSLATGFSLATMLNNSGGAWDNAKKFIEKGNLGGKGSDTHKSAVTGDTVGDPFKDTAGPALNILMKLMTMVSVVFSGFVVKYSEMLMGLFK
jgi:K(+)-stimulated pyrophosphate-energized sodium pump